MVMRIVVHGQEAFGKAVLEKLIERKENLVAVFCAPDKAGRAEDPLKVFAKDKGLPVHQPKELENAGGARAHEVGQRRPVRDGLRDAVRTPAGARCSQARHHPVSSLAIAAAPRSLLDQLAHRHGPERTGLSIFWPDEGLDEGPILLQKKVEIGPDETLGDVYFKKLFP